MATFRVASCSFGPAPWRFGPAPSCHRKPPLLAGWAPPPGRVAPPRSPAQGAAAWRSKGPAGAKGQKEGGDAPAGAGQREGAAPFAGLCGGATRPRGGAHSAGGSGLRWQEGAGRQRYGAGPHTQEAISYPSRQSLLPSLVTIAYDGFRFSTRRQHDQNRRPHPRRNAL